MTCNKYHIKCFTQIRVSDFNKLVFESVLLGVITKEHIFSAHVSSLANYLWLSIL